MQARQKNCGNIGGSRREPGGHTRSMAAHLRRSGAATDAALPPSPGKRPTGHRLAAGSTPQFHHILSITYTENNQQNHNKYSKKIYDLVEFSLTQVKIYSVASGANIHWNYSRNTRNH